MKKIVMKVALFFTTTTVYSGNITFKGGNSYSQTVRIQGIFIKKKFNPNWSTLQRIPYGQATDKKTLTVSNIPKSVTDVLFRLKIGGATFYHPLSKIDQGNELIKKLQNNETITLQATPKKRLKAV